MAFNRFTKNVLNVSALPDRVQNQAQTLKATFDQAGADIKVALNALIAELEASTASSNIGADVASVTTKTVQAILSAFEEEILNRYTKNEIDTLVSGNTNDLVADVDVNLTTGVITVTKKDGTVETFDTALEKVPAKFEIVENGSSLFLKITNVDGTSTQTNITELMNIYDFNNTNDIAFNVTGTGNEKVVTANIRANSIGLDKLSLSVVSTLEGYMTSARDSANAAKISENNARSSANIATNAAEKASIAEGLANTAINKATEAESYAHGGTGTREGEDTDNAKYYSQVAKEVAGGDFVTPTEMEAYAQKKGTVPSFEGEELSGEVIEVENLLALESKLHISGNSEQDSRSGKNLIHPDYIINGAFSVDASVVENNSGYTETNNTKYRVVRIPDLPAGTYTFSVNWNYTARIIRDYRDGTIATRGVDNNTYTFTTTTDGLYALCFRNTDSTDFTDDEYTIQIEQGTTATSYEPYGVQPSPDYPSEIRSVKSKSDNLFDISTKKDNTTFIWASGAENASTGKVLSDFISLEGIKNISCNYKFYIAYYDSNKTFLGNSYDFRTTGGVLYKENCLIPQGTNAAYCRLSFATGNYQVDSITDMTAITDIMVNEGTEVLPYEPYGYVPVEVRVEGKNLLYIPNNELTHSGGDGTCSIKEQSITINGTSKSGYTINLIGDSNSTTPIIKFEANQTYYMKMFVEGGSVSSNGSDVQLRNSSGNIVAKTMAQWIAGFTYTPTENIDITWLRIYLGAYTFTNYKFKLQVSRVNLNEWVDPAPLKTLSLPLGDIQLRSTPDGTRDTFERVDGVWNVLSNIESVIFDGDETISKSEYGTNTYNMNISNKIIENPNSIITISNYFTGVNYNDRTINNTNIMYSNQSAGTYNRIIVRNTNFTTLEEFKTWLASNPTEVVYPLLEPIYTPITDTALIQALDELESLILHKGYNRITVTSVNGVKAYLDLSIPATALVTNITETDAANDMIVPVVEGEGNVLVKIPVENQMTLNPSTGVVKVKGKNIATEEYVGNAIASAITGALGGSY